MPGILPTEKEESNQDWIKVRDANSLKRRRGKVDVRSNADFRISEPETDGPTLWEAQGRIAGSG